MSGAELRGSGRRLGRGAWALGLGAIGLLAAIPASATVANDYTVAVGGSIAPGQHTFVMASDATVSMQTEKPDGTFLYWTCSSIATPPAATTVSSVTSGTQVSDLATVPDLRFASCSTFGGALAFTPTGSWTLRGTSPATTGSSDIVRTRFDDVGLRIGNAVCRITIVGGLDGSFNEATQKLTIDERADGTGAEATMPDVVGCLGQVKRGGKVRLAATFSTSAVGGAVNLQP